MNFQIYFSDFLQNIILAIRISDSFQSFQSLTLKFGKRWSRANIWVALLDWKCSQLYLWFHTNICGLTQIFMGLVVARFHYALPAITGQILVNDLHRIDAIFAKAFRWQLTSIVPSAADIVDNAGKKTIPLCPQPHSLLTPYASTSKMLTVDVYASKEMVAYYPWQKRNVIRTASSSRVGIAMLSISLTLFIAYISFLTLWLLLSGNPAIDYL